MIRVTVKEMKKLGENNNTSGNEPTWTTQGGKTILVKDMSTTHILNSIKKIKSTGWRAGMLPILEEELTRRNLNVSGSAVVDIKNLEIKKSEMEYFLETSCDYQIIDGKEDIYSHITTPIPQDLVEYMKQSFAIPENMDKDDFIDSMISDVTYLSCKNFYKKYEQYILENTFEKSWKIFINIMLGRKEETIDE